MNNKIIWVDLDEVLAELLDYILDYNDYKIWNYSLKKEDIKDYYIHLIPELNIWPEDAIAWFRKPMLEDINNLQILPVNWSIEKLKQLKNNWNKLIIVTARIEDIFWEYTKKWVENYFPNIFDEIIFTDHFSDKHRDKWDVASELWIEFMIEDNYDYALNLAEKWVKTYVLEKPWNYHRSEFHENIVKINNWSEFMEEKNDNF